MKETQEVFGSMIAELDEDHINSHHDDEHLSVKAYKHDEGMDTEMEWDESDNSKTIPRWWTWRPTTKKVLHFAGWRLRFSFPYARGISMRTSARLHIYFDRSLFKAQAQATYSDSPKKKAFPSNFHVQLFLSHEPEHPHYASGGLS